MKFNIPVDKEQNIYKASLIEFYEHGYKNGSTNNIVKDAGISKGTLFNYFGSKRNLFIYIVKKSLETIEKPIINAFDDLPLDMFDRMVQVSMVKGEVAFEFKMESGIVIQAFGELYNEFKAELEVDYNRYVLLTNELLLKNIDYSKFKEDVNVNKVLEIIIYVSEGLNNKFIAQYKGDYKEIMKNIVKIRAEALSYMDIIKKSVYK